MTDFVNGYAPSNLTGSLNAYLDGPPQYLDVNFSLSVNGATQELEDALLAGIAAISASIAANFPGASVTTAHRVSGAKEL